MRRGKKRRREGREGGFGQQSTCLESRVLWVRVPPEAAHLSVKMTSSGELRCVALRLLTHVQCTMYTYMFNAEFEFTCLSG